MGNTQMDFSDSDATRSGMAWEERCGVAGYRVQGERGRIPISPSLPYARYSDVLIENNQVDPTPVVFEGGDHWGGQTDAQTEDRAREMRWRATKRSGAERRFVE